MNGEGEPPPFLISLLMVKMMVVIDINQGLLLESFSHMMRTTTMSAKTAAHFPRA